LGVVSAGPIVATFSEPAGNGGHRLQHLVVDKHSALVYVGAVNRLYQLSPELERQVTVETGPREDSPECPAVDCLGSVIKRLTDNVNKALVIDYTDTRLIACGTLYQGIYFHNTNTNQSLLLVLCLMKNVVSVWTQVFAV
jgi:plexin A